MLQSALFPNDSSFRISREHLTDRIIKTFSIEYFPIAKQYFVQILMKRSISNPFEKQAGKKKGNVSSYMQLLSDEKEHTKILSCSITVLIVNFI